MDAIINKVANSHLVTIDLKDFSSMPNMAVIDISSVLYRNLILRELDFRTFIKEHNWSQYKDLVVSVHCSADVIIPNWAYMLMVAKLHGVAKEIYFGDKSELLKLTTIQNIKNNDWSQYKDKKVVIKGCSEILYPEIAFLEITKLLMPYASSIMYGEPCSTVPVFKKKP